MTRPERNALIRKVSATTLASVVQNRVADLFRQDVPAGQWTFGFDPTQPEYEPFVFACDADGTRTWDQHTTEPFLLYTWGAQKVVLPATAERDETEAVRVVLIDPQGDTLAFASAGIVTSLDLIRALKGDGPYDPPLPVVVVRISTNGGRQILKLRPVTRTKDAKHKQP